MIPVLFKADATDFRTFGIGALKDCTMCEVTEERNGAYECVFKYPITGALYKEILAERLVKAKPNDTADDQAFRIYRISTPINGEVTVYAQHISYDLSHIAALQWSSESVSAPLAMERVFTETATEHNFTCLTDYSSAKKFAVSRPQSVRACLGGVAGSFLDLWGGEYEWDNFKVIHHQGRGKHTGVVIEYGKNLTSLEHDSDTTEVFTDLLPYAVRTAEDGTESALTLPEVLLPIADTNLTQRKTYIKDFSEYFSDENPLSVEGLREYATRYIENNPLGMIAPTLTVAFEPLWKMPEYAAVLERVSLCDTVTVRHSYLGITAKAKVITTVYDTLAEKYISITLGTAKANLLDSVSAAEKNAENATAAIERFPVLMNTAIKNATDLITGQTGGYVVINSASDTGLPSELLVLDAPSVDEAVNVWRWNVGGLGFSSKGYNGPYDTAITADGQIVADFITSGKLVANIIKAGVLQSQDGSSYWDLESGEIVLKAYATAKDVEGFSDRLSAVESKQVYRMQILSSHGSFFKNGVVNTTLTAKVYLWNDDVSGELDEACFLWTRSSADPEADEIWNRAHASGTKALEVSPDDINESATFVCTLLESVEESAKILTADRYAIMDYHDAAATDTAPENPHVGMLWVNTSVVPPETMVWDGVSWVLENNVGDLRESVESNTTKYGELQSSVDGLNSYVGSLTTSVETLGNQYLGEQERFESIEAKMTSLEQSVDGLSVSVQRQYAGGINLLKNSSGLNGITDDWVTSGSVSTDATTDAQNSTTANSCFVLGPYSTLGQTITGAVTGTAYTIAFRAKKTTGAYNSFVRVHYNGYKSIDVVNTTDAFGWTEFSAVIDDVQDGTIKLSISNRAGTLYIGDIIIAEGTTIHKWTPAPNEIYTTEVKIDHRGIEVSNSDSAQRTVINNTEFSGYYNDEKIFTLNKDETVTKKTTVDGELTVGKTKFVPLPTSTEGMNIVILD